MSDGTRVTLAQLAEWTDGRVEGDPGVEVTRPAPLETAGPGELGLVADEAYLGAVQDSAAGALLVSAALAERLQDTRPRVVVEDARAAMVPLLQRLDPTPRPAPGVHPTAVLGSDVFLGEGVSIGAYAVLEAGVAVGPGSVVGAHCVLGAGARLGSGCYLHPHVVLYPNTALGDRVSIHAGARLGSDGFGYVVRDGRYVKVPQVGGCLLEDDVEVGANACIDRGSIGDTVVGTGTKLDNLVHLAHNVRVGKHGVMAAMVGIAGSTVIGDWAQFGGQAGAIGHLTLGEGVRVSAQAGIIGDLGDQATVTGFPARDQRKQMKAWAALPRVPDLLKRMRSLEKQLEELRARLEGDSG